MDKNIYAAIAMALYEYQGNNVHDKELGVPHRLTWLDSDDARLLVVYVIALILIECHGNRSIIFLSIRFLFNVITLAYSHAS